LLMKNEGTKVVNNDPNKLSFCATHQQRKSLKLRLFFMIVDRNLLLGPISSLTTSNLLIVLLLDLILSLSLKVWVVK
jgi:hypothetical protein